MVAVGNSPLTLKALDFIHTVYFCLWFSEREANNSINGADRSVFVTATVGVYSEVPPESYNIIQVKNSGILQLDALTISNSVPMFQSII